MGWGDIDTGIVRHDPSLDKIDSIGRGSLVMWWERVGCDIGFIGRRDHLFVDKILDLMTLSETTVGVVTVLLVIRAVFCWAMRGREWIR